jgi:hypothetical protein
MSAWNARNERQACTLRYQYHHHEQPGAAAKKKALDRASGGARLVGHVPLPLYHR